jgi:hypothetical protein
MIILSIILAVVITASFFIVRNLDQKGSFVGDDEIGFFFKEVAKIQEALNEFTLK